MMKVNLTKSLLLLCVGTAVLTYSCSQDDIYEDMEEEYVRSLAKRQLNTPGEGSTPVSPVAAGYYYNAESLSRKFTLDLSWTAGFINDNSRGPSSDLTISVTRKSPINCQILSVKANWYASGNHGISGTIHYSYETAVKKVDKDGKEYIDWVKKEGDDSFNIIPRLTYITLEQLKDARPDYYGY